MVDGRLDQRRQAANDLHHMILKRRGVAGMERGRHCECIHTVCFLYVLCVEYELNVYPVPSLE